MKLRTVLAFTSCAAALAFVGGQLSQPARLSGPGDAEEIRAPEPSRTLPARAPRSPVNGSRALGKYASVTREVSAESAARLTSEQRLQLLEKGALAGDYGNQEAMLCGLISALTRDEIQRATDILGRVQDQGNRQGPEVWKSLWQQWGRVDPMGCLSYFGADAVAKSTVDARHVMTGWLETDADAALAWAWQPGKSALQSAAAALAISRSVNGNLRELESSILELPADEATAQACIEDYFDLATLSQAEQTAAATYETIRPELRQAAWGVAARRIGHGDLAEAKSWLTRHAHDPGRDYNEVSDLFSSLAHKDPAGTAIWATQLPFNPASDPFHPASLPLFRWRQSAPAAADAWIKSQPADAAWIPRDPFESH